MKCQSFGKSQEGLACFVLFPPLLLIRTLLGTRVLCLGQVGAGGGGWTEVRCLSSNSDPTDDVTSGASTFFQGLSVSHLRKVEGVPPALKFSSQGRTSQGGQGPPQHKPGAPEQGRMAILSAGRKTSRAVGIADPQA